MSELEAIARDIRSLNGWAQDLPVIPAEWQSAAYAVAQALERAEHRIGVSAWLDWLDA